MNQGYNKDNFNTIEKLQLRKRCMTAAYDSLKSLPCTEGVTLFTSLDTKIHSPRNLTQPAEI